MHFQDYKTKILSFLDLPFQPAFLEHLGVLGTGIGAEDPRYPEGCLPERNSATNNWL